MSVHWSLVVVGVLLAAVIVTVFALAVFIYFADTIFIYVFKNGLGLW